MMWYIWLSITGSNVIAVSTWDYYSHGRFWSSENRKESHDDKLAVTIINRQLVSYVDSYDHASRSIACSYDHCIGAVTIILPENKTTISLILRVNRVFCLVTDDDQSHIYVVCKLYVPPWHASITIRPGPNSPSYEWTTGRFDIKGSEVSSYLHWYHTL